LKMAKHSEARAVVVSGKIYRGLLMLYPAEHRREYGALMAQLFQDQCRDARRAAGGWALTLLWLRTAIDLAKSLPLEHWRDFKQRRTMFNKIVLAFRGNALMTFLGLFSAVFVVVLGVSIAMALMTPEQYASKARIRVVSPAKLGVLRTPGDAQRRLLMVSPEDSFVQHQVEAMRSDAVLGRVAKELNLAQAWGADSAGAALGEADTINRLRGMVDLQPGGKAQLIDVRVRSTESVEAASIANALVRAYREVSMEQQSSAAGTPAQRLVEIVETAMPSGRPFAPNKPLTVFLGFFGGTFLALAIGGVGAVVVLLKRRKSPPIAMA
jgi:capsular polysaccharide biosynthesis protein